jgi:hypothetical protein
MVYGGVCASGNSDGRWWQCGEHDDDERAGFLHFAQRAIAATWLIGLEREREREINVGHVD